MNAFDFIWSVGPFLAGAVLCSLLLLLAWIDIKTGYLPDVLTLPLIWAGLLVNLNGLFASLQDAVLGAAGGYLILWSANSVYRLIAGRDGMGYGDFKLTAALGAWFGLPFVPWIVLGASAAGLGAATARRGLGWDSTAPLPFGPYLAGAGMIALALAFSR